MCEWCFYDVLIKNEEDGLAPYHILYYTMKLESWVSDQKILQDRFRGDEPKFADADIVWIEPTHLDFCGIVKTEKESVGCSN